MEASRAPVDSRRLEVPRIYAIADRDALGGETALPAAVAAMAEAGVRWIQLRMKGASGAAVYTIAERCCRALAGSGALLWLDDRADVAALLPVDGVHFGQRDLPPAAARPMLRSGTLIGASAHDDAQVAAADADPAVDVVAIGPVFATRSKRASDPVVGLDGVRAARQLTDKPLVAIGGIDETNLDAVLRAGADAVAVLSAACRGDVIH
ncbi:MAG TPA: thiamine phosphate synthase, partial [Thermoanaerobaculia bacterium]|nr:thiamine phosphate synthase [Thermoanaerobaculia bacterium]